MAKARAKLPSSEPVLMLGNKEGYEAPYVAMTVAGSLGEAANVRNWIFHKGAVTIDNPTTVKAFTMLQSWQKKGYLPSDVNALSWDDSVADFAKGQGVFYFEGSWDAAIVKAGLKSAAGAAAMPPSVAGGPHASIGSTSGPWHISSKTKNPDLAAAWLNYIISSPAAVKLMYQQQQIPAILGAKAPTNDPFLNQMVAVVEAGEPAERARALHGLVDADDAADHQPGPAEAARQPDAARRRGQGAAVGLGEVRQHAEVAREFDGSDGTSTDLAPTREPRRRDTSGRAGAVPSKRGRRKRNRAPGEPRRLTAYLYILPALVAYGIFTLVPLLHAGYLSFFHWDGLTPKRYVGFGTTSTPRDPASARRSPTPRALRLYAVVPVPLGLLLTALLTRLAVHGLTFFRTVLFLPQRSRASSSRRRSSGSTTPTARSTAFLELIGLGSLDPRVARRLQLGADIRRLPSARGSRSASAWSCSSPACRRSRPTLYEAARVDGAGALREFFAVTLPGLRNELVVAVVADDHHRACAASTSSTTRRTAAPAARPEVPSRLMFQTRSRYNQVGYACAIAVAARDHHPSSPSSINLALRGRRGVNVPPLRPRHHLRRADRVLGDGDLSDPLDHLPRVPQEDRPRHGLLASDHFSLQLVQRRLERGRLRAGLRRSQNASSSPARSRWSRRCSRSCTGYAFGTMRFRGDGALLRPDRARASSSPTRRRSSRSTTTSSASTCGHLLGADPAADRAVRLVRRRSGCAPSSVSAPRIADRGGPHRRRRELRHPARILLPQARPALLTLCALVFMYTWNEFLLALVLHPERRASTTAPLGLSFFASAAQGHDPTKVAAAAILVAGPILLVYVFLQRHFIRGLLAGAVKE